MAHAADLLHLGRWFPRSEDGGADTHAGGAFFDSDGEVVGHAHGELGEGWDLRKGCVAQATKFLKVGACLFAGVGDVGGPGWDGHEAAGDQGFEGLEGFEE